MTENTENLVDLNKIREAGRRTEPCERDGCGERVAPDFIYLPFCSWNCREEYFDSIGAGRYSSKTSTTRSEDDRD